MYFYIGPSSQSAKEINMNYMNSYCTQECVKSIVDGKLQCKCGEDVGIFNWCWSKSNSSSNETILSESNREILFHPLYSSGTAAVRGDVPFLPNKHYYWEVKMISNLYGTDVMVGVGTSKIVLTEWKFKFGSMLGIDSQSWGYSYHGNIQHNKLVRQYGSQFGLGSIVGVHLDMCQGTLEYYLNRKPMGIAFTSLKGRELYPMVSSTAAQSAVRMTCAVSEEPTLQLACLQFISKNPALYQKYKEIPGLTRIYERKYFWIVPTNEEEEKKRLAELEEKLMCPLNYSNFIKRNKKFRAIRWIPPDDDSTLSGLDLSDEYHTQESSTEEDLQENISLVLEGPSTSKETNREEYRTKIRRTDLPDPTSSSCSTQSAQEAENSKGKNELKADDDMDMSAGA